MKPKLSTSKLTKQALRSKLTVISFVFEGERISFNLLDETRINEDNVDREIANHITPYSFLLKLQAELAKKLKIEEIELDSLKAKLYSFYKRKTENGRPPSNDLVGMMVAKNAKYIKKAMKIAEYEHSKSIIAASIRAFETRKDLLQTLSANRRKEI